MVVRLGELMMILDLHRQGLSVTAIARRTGRDPKTVRKYIERGLEPPVYGPRQVGRPSKLAPYLDYLRERVASFPDLSAVRLTRELRERGYKGGLYRCETVRGGDPAREPAEAVRGRACPMGPCRAKRVLRLSKDEVNIREAVWTTPSIVGTAVAAPSRLGRGYRM